MTSQSCKIISVGGISAGGKTTFVDALFERLSPHLRVGRLRLDNCYRDLVAEGYDDDSRRCLEINPEFNWDHPDIINWSKPIEWYDTVKQGRGFQVAQYCFSTHSYQQSSAEVLEESIASNLEVMLCEGHLLLHNAYLRERSDHSYFVFTPSEVGVVRRFKRDLEQRGRSADSIYNQLTKTVLPMQDKYISPCAQLPDVEIVLWYNHIEGIKQLSTTIESSSVNGTGVCGYIRQRLEDGDEIVGVLQELFEVIHPQALQNQEIENLVGHIEVIAQRIYFDICGKNLPRATGPYKAIESLFCRQ